jgi:hypothetical protein
MARSARYFLPDQPLHIIQRGNNRGAIFFAPADCGRYRFWLGEAAAEHGSALCADDQPRCARPATAAGPWAASVSSGRSPRRWDGA